MVTFSQSFALGCLMPRDSGVQNAKMYHHTQDRGLRFMDIYGMILSPYVARVVLTARHKGLTSFSPKHPQ